MAAFVAVLKTPAMIFNAILPQLLNNHATMHLNDSNNYSTMILHAILVVLRKLINHYPARPVT
jgi:hypothetical protein